MRALSVDFGSKRIGLAVGDDEFGITTARQNLIAAGSLAKDAAAIENVARGEGAELIVVGLPLDKEGNLTKMASVCMQLVDRLRQLGLEVATVNESMTSMASEENLRAQYGRTRMGQLVDGESARLILEEFFRTKK